MKCIGVSQRIDSVPGRNEVRDSLDTRWGWLCRQLNIMAVPIGNSIPDVKLYLDEFKFDGFILSGGNDLGKAQGRDYLERSILDHSKKLNLPVLGVCRGMQLINQYQGGQLIKVSGHVGSMHSELQGRWAEDFGISRVNSFHNYGISLEGLGNSLEAMVVAEDGVVEACRHVEFNWVGLMWHPERNERLDNWDEQIMRRLFFSDVI